MSTDFQTGLALATLWQEARGEDQTAREVVAHVIRNRMTKLYDSDGTIAGTVLKRWQFSGWMSARLARQALRAVAIGGTLIDQLEAAWDVSATGPDPTEGAVLYYSPESMRSPTSRPRWAAKAPYITTIGPFRLYGA